MDKNFQNSKNISLPKVCQNQDENELESVISINSNQNQKQKCVLRTNVPKSRNKHILLPESVSLENEDFIIANAQISLRQNSKKYYDVYNNWADIVQISFYTNEDLSCPICMESPIIPRTDICGHVYCLPCLNKFLSLKSLFDNKCAICNQIIDIARVKRAGTIYKPVIKIGDPLSMLLMKRNKNLIFPTPINTDLCSIPLINTFESRFSNLVICSNENLLSIIQMEIMALEDEFLMALKDGSDRIDFISDSLDSVKKDFSSISLDESFKASNQSFTSDVTIEYLRQTMADESVYYQSEEGCNVFLAGLNWRCLTHEFLDQDRCLPDRLSSRVVDLERLVVTAELHHRYRYMRHLPFGTPVTLVVLDLTEVLSPATLDVFGSAIQKQTDSRLHKEMLDEMDTISKIHHENSFHDGSKFFRVPSAQNAVNRPIAEDSGDQRSYRQIAEGLSQPSLTHQIVNMSLNDSEAPSRGISLSDCIVVVKPRRKNKKR